MKFVCITDWNQLPASANALFAQAAQHSVFFSRAWFECLSTTALEADHTLVLACVVSRDQVMAILPMMQSMGVNTWYSLRHGFTPCYNLLLADEDQEQVITCLVDALNRLPINGLLLEPVADDDRTLNDLLARLTRAGYHGEYRFRHYNWIHRLQGQSYAQYLAARPAQLRNTVARKQRKLAREHGYDIRLLTGYDVPPAMADYYRVYEASWKQHEINNAGFADCFIEKFSKAGWTRLAILYIKGQPVAAQLWFVHQQKASIFRLVYDEAWRQYSPGSILTSALMEYVIDTDKVTEIDFLTGNDAYKQDWMSERRERFQLSFIKRKLPASRYQRAVNALQCIFKRR